LGNGQAVVKLILIDDANAHATIDGKPVDFAEALAEAGRVDAVVMMAGTISEEGADRATFTDKTGKQLAAPASLGSGLDWYTGRSNTITTASGDNQARNSGTVAMIEKLMSAPSSSGRTMAAKSVLVLKDNAGVALPASLVGAKGPAILRRGSQGRKTAISLPTPCLAGSTLRANCR
jgi:beta-glucosidase